MEQTQIKQETDSQKKSGIRSPKKKNKWLRRGLSLAVAAALVVGLVWYLGRPGQNLSLGYIPSTAEARDVTVAVTGTGTVQPIDSYQVTALVKAGKTLEEVKAAKPTAEYDAVWGQNWNKPDTFVELSYNGIVAHSKK